MKGICLGTNANKIINDLLAAIENNLGITATTQIEETSWLRFTLNPFPELFMPGFQNIHFKAKDAFLKKPLTDAQVATVWKYVTAQAPVGGGLGMATYGGKVNAVSPDAAASPQRNSIFDIACNTGWIDPSGEAPSLEWVRNFYKELFAASGGVPVPNEQADGCMINHPDTDLADPQWNQSGIPWPTLYYKENYPRLQQLKRNWDPLNIFHHALSIRADK